MFFQGAGSAVEQLSSNLRVNEQINPFFLESTALAGCCTKAGLVRRRWLSCCRDRHDKFRFRYWTARVDIL